MDELEKQIKIIRAAYPWLEEDTIQRYAEQAVKNKIKNEYNGN